MRCSTTSGLGEARYRKVESYSTGMKQRLKLASAIVHDPKLLILDEPTNGMDPAGREEILELARDLSRNKGMSLLFSSHLLPDVEAVCDYVVVLGGGRLLTQGKHRATEAAAQPLFRGAAQGRTRAVLLDDWPRRGLHGRRAGRFAARAASGGRSPQAALWEIAAEQQLQIRHLRPQRSTLEEVFLEGGGATLMPIFDQGYQHWNGPLVGPCLALAGRSRATACGSACKGRCSGSFLLLALLPAAALAGRSLAMWGLIGAQADVL